MEQKDFAVYDNEALHLLPDSLTSVGVKKDHGGLSYLRAQRGLDC